jgi:phospholipid/cholesterol/gamma-HCH transport system substrate-binding protein
MSQPNRSDVGTVIFMLLGFAGIGYLALQIPGNRWPSSRASQGYQVTAKFDNIGGLKVDSPVKMGGVRVGRVESINVETTDYKALVTLLIDRRYDQIPQDSDAAIQTAGLLGGNFIGLTPGGSDAFLRAGTQIESTQSAFSIEGAINKLLSSASGEAAPTGAKGSALARHPH